MPFEWAVWGAGEAYAADAAVDICVIVCRNWESVMLRLMSNAAGVGLANVAAAPCWCAVPDPPALSAMLAITIE